MTQEDLAERSGLHRTYIVGVETGERNLSLDAIHKIARGLGRPPRDLFSKAVSGQDGVVSDSGTAPDASPI